MDSTNPTPTLRPTRRTALGVTIATAVGALALPEAAQARRAPRAPETVALPDGIQPEGITSGPGTRFYVGSLNDGRIVTGDLLTGSVSVLLPGATGRQLRGLFWDERSNLVWAAGNVGSVGHVWAVDGRTGAVVQDVVVPGSVFLNDLVVTDTTVWVTDSRVDRLTGVAVTPAGAPTGAAPVFLPLSGDWPAGDGVANNANGIRELADGRLVLNNARTGQLFAVDAGSGVAQEIPVEGGPGLVGGDGLEIDGRFLYDVRGSGQYEVSVLELRESPAGWTARWRGARTDETLDIPSTATLAGGWLWAVNARFGVASPATASYWITRRPAR